MDFDILIVNGTVVDGTGAAGKPLDVGLSGERIRALADLQGQSARTVIDATGCIVAPGFVDIHSHGDTFTLACPRADSKVLDGVTTEVSGNCGASPFPLNQRMRDRISDSAQPLGIQVDWPDADGFFARQEAVGTAINRAHLAGHGALRSFVIGRSAREPTAEELDLMRRELAVCLEQGALGLSSGLIYPPGCYATTHELIALCDVAAHYGVPYCTHIRSEGDAIESAVEEVAKVARATGVRVQLSHVKVSGRRNWGKIRWLKQKLSALRDEGVDLCGDRYPYIASSTDLDVVLPNWMLEGGPDAELERLATRETRDRAAEQVLASIPDAEYWNEIRISSVTSAKNRPLEGKSIAEVAALQHKSPIDTVFDLLIEEKRRVAVIIFCMCEENLREVLSWPFVMIGSDCAARADHGPTSKGKPHPRAFGTFARTLGRYVREEKVLRLEEALFKMTGQPANHFGLQERGCLKPGYFADVTIFHPEHISDQATYDNPQQYSKGIKYVLVNGKLVVAGGRHTGALPGHVLRRT